jgi:hypothetical protein
MQRTQRLTRCVRWQKRSAHSKMDTLQIIVYLEFLNSEGVFFVYFLKALLNADFEL